MRNGAPQVIADRVSIAQLRTVGGAPRVCVDWVSFDGSDVVNRSRLISIRTNKRSDAETGGFPAGIPRPVIAQLSIDRGAPRVIVDWVSFVDACEFERQRLTSRVGPMRDGAPQIIADRVSIAPKLPIPNVRPPRARRPCCCAAVARSWWRNCRTGSDMVAKLLGASVRAARRCTPLHQWAQPDESRR